METPMTTRVTPFLMFTGQAEEAMGFYVSLFEDGAVVNISRYGAEHGDAAGKVVRAEFVIAGQSVYCIDSPMEHDFTFTPSISLFVDCADEAQLDRLFAALSVGGGVMMPPADYGFSRKFTWISDRWGVSWQLNLPAAQGSST